MEYEHLLVEIEDRVKIITMNRPEVLNAMNHKLDGELHHAVMSGQRRRGRLVALSSPGQAKGPSRQGVISTSSGCMRRN